MQEYQLESCLTSYLKINKWTLGSFSISEHSDLRNNFITIVAAGLVVRIIILLKLREEAKKSSWFIDLFFCLAWNKWIGINSLCIYWLLYKRTCTRAVEYRWKWLRMSPDKPYEIFMGSILFEHYILIFVIFRENRKLI